MILPSAILSTLLLLLLTQDVLTTSPNTSSISNGIQRLPNTTKPLSYDVGLIVDFDQNQSEFDGKVSIRIHVLETVSEIVLHSKELIISNISLFNVSSGVLSNFVCRNVSKISDSVNDFLKLKPFCGSDFMFRKNDQWLIEIHYKGRIRSNGPGLFRIEYETGNKTKAYAVASDNEPIGARLVFPCYDEPALKAKFKLTLTYSNNYKASSNMPVQQEVQHKNQICTTIFKSTPIMSTYIFAFFIGKFETVSKENSKIQFRISARPSVVKQSFYALNQSPIILRSIEKYLNQPYSLEKIDNIALPKFHWGAMENWGLITYRESSFVTLKEKSLEKETKISYLLAHEFAHQWFGNLVTPQWWSDVWLTEGLSAFLESEILEMVLFTAIDSGLKVGRGWWQTFYVENVWNFDFDQLFITNRFQIALEDDAKVSSHPLNYSPKSNHEIIQLFDSISYNKGASIFRMIKHILTDRIFRKALNTIINERKYETIDQNIFFAYFKLDWMAEYQQTENEIVDFSKSLRTWTEQSGYPLVTVTRDYSIGSFRLKQEPFQENTKSTHSTQSVADRRLWWIPINFATANYPDFSLTTAESYLDSQENHTIAPAIKRWSHDDWIILNKQSTGFYRVNYDARNWNLIMLALIKDHEMIHVNNRAQLINDAYHLYLASRLNASVFLDLLKYMPMETKYAPWKTVSDILSSIRLWLSYEEEATADLSEFIRDLLKAPYDNLGLNSSDNDYSYLEHSTRNIIINLACQAGYKRCIAETKTEFHRLLSGNTNGEMDYEMKKVILCNGMIAPTAIDFSSMLQLLFSSSDKEERRNYMDALGCIEEPGLLRLYLTTAMKRTVEINYSADEMLYVLKSVVRRGHIGLATAIDFLKENYAEYSTIKAGNRKAIDEALADIGPLIVNKRLELSFNHLNDLLQNRSLISENHLKPIEETIRSRLDFSRRFSEPIVKWCEGYAGVKRSNEVKGMGRAPITPVNGILFVSIATVFVFS